MPTASLATPAFIQAPKAATSLIDQDTYNEISIAAICLNIAIDRHITELEEVIARCTRTT